MPKHVLVAPLDWGMGHTTRCIPVVRSLLAAGMQVTAAGTVAQLTLLQSACPGIGTVMLGGYGIRYSRKWLPAKLLAQVPRIFRAIRKEHRWLRRFTAGTKVDGIISDNRYGLWHVSIPTIILTHQTAPAVGFGRIADRIVAAGIAKMLQRFDNCWIADRPVNPLAGKLSKQKKLPKAVFAGLLSQCVPGETAEAGNPLLVLLSGPEPQRTLLSNLLWAQALRYDGNVVFVEGRAGAARQPPAHIRHIPLAGADEVAGLIQSAGLVLCRSGYSTVMDLARLGARALLIPTPGQGEQEYLARHCAAKGWFPTMRQHGFSLRSALALADQFPFYPAAAPEDFELFEPLLHAWVDSL